MATINKGFLDTKINGISINSSKKCHTSNYNSSSARNVLYIVMHYTGNKKDTAAANANYFQRANCKASAHFFVDDTSIYQSVALKNIAWHCGGSSYYHTCRNSTALGIEMCCTAGDYKISEKTINNSAHLCAYLCELLNITASEVDKYVLRHYDVTHKKCPAQMAESAEDKDWLAFKKQVKDILGGSKPAAASKELYRVRKAWNNASSQVGAFSSLDNAKEACDKAGKDYKVYSSTGKVVYPTPTFKAYKVEITADSLNVRAGAGTGYAINTTVKQGEIYTIVEEKSGWGKLKSGAGWISLAYTRKYYG